MPDGQHGASAAPPLPFLSTADQSVPSALREIAAHIPNQLAVDSGAETLSYAELVDRAGQVANAILDRAPERGLPIANLCGYGVSPVIGMHGVLSAGHFVTNLDAREPVERIAKTLHASGAVLVVTDREHVDLAREILPSGKVVVLDETLREPVDVPPFEIGPDTPSLVVFTSGSTGAPKGVVLGHLDIVPRAAWYSTVQRVIPGDRIAFTNSFGFAAAGRRALDALVIGATLCTYDVRTLGLRGLADWIRSEQISMGLFVPSTLRAMADTFSGPVIDSMRLVTLAGEALFWHDVRRAHEMFASETQLYNSFGSSEAGGIARYLIPWDLPLEDGPVPLGIVEPTIEIRLVDDDDNPVADGEPGRIVMVGPAPHLALGYWNDPDLTAAHFFSTADGRRGFRTSDSARWRPDGLLEQVGRLDSRVKVRGAMVAMSEVEQALALLPDVADAVVVATTAPDGGSHLVGYVVATPGATLSTAKLRRELARSLPFTSVPGTYVALDALPRTVRNKVDRAALPPPPPVAVRPYRKPVGYEVGLAHVFADVLGLDQVGADDDFFDLGGDSFAVIELTDEIMTRFAVDTATSTVLEAPTVAQLALRLDVRRPRGASVAVLVSPGTGTPWFCATGAGMPAMTFRALADVLPGRPFYGLQPRGLEERARADRSIAAAVKRNLAAVRAIQPHGPYLLGGYSYGGLVAFEMACRLEAAGERVDLLVLLDKTAPGGRPPPPTLGERARARDGQIHAETSGGRLGSVARARRWARFGARFARVHGTRAIALALAGVWRQPGLAQRELFMHLNARMARRYRPGCTFGGAALVVRSAEHDTGEVDDLGWSEFVTGPIEVAALSTHHLGLIRGPAAGELGRRLQAAFDGS